MSYILLILLVEYTFIVKYEKLEQSSQKIFGYGGVFYHAPWYYHTIWQV